MPVFRMRATWLLILVIYMAGDHLPLLQSGAEGPAGRSSAEVSLEWDASSLRFERMPDGHFLPVLPGYVLRDQPGSPRIPYTSTLIALSPGVSITLRVDWLHEEELHLPGPLALYQDPDGMLNREIAEEDLPADEPEDPLFPRMPVVVEEAGILRGVHLARVVFTPIYVSNGRLRFVSRARARLLLQGLSPRLEIDPDAMDPIYQQLRRWVRNPEHLIPAPPSSGLQSAARLASFDTPVAFIEVSRPGLYRVAYEDLPPDFATINPSGLRLFRGDREVAYEWLGDEDDRFEPGEAILFYAEPRFSRWSAQDVYRLEAGSVSGIRMAVRAASPEGLATGTKWTDLLVERNLIYIPDSFTPGVPPNRDGDRWAWDYLVGPSDIDRAYTFHIPAVDVRYPATLTLWLSGRTAGSHRWSVRLNHVPLGEVSWSGRIAITATLSVPTGTLMALTNTLYLRPVLGESGWLDAFSVTWAWPGSEPVDFLSFTGEIQASAYRIARRGSAPYQIYEITDPLRPLRLIDFIDNGSEIIFGDVGTGGPHRYLVASTSAITVPDRIRSPETLLVSSDLPDGADYLVITHPAFIEAGRRLAEHRRNQGLSTALVNVLGIYDAYGEGRPDPEALRRFIADAYARWSPRPLYVVLIGDGSFDPRGYRKESPPTYIPPFLADVDPRIGETAADNRYAAVDGADPMPDVMLGRIPAGSPEEAARVVDKIIDYETRPLPGDWNFRVVLVADDPDAAGDFIDISESMAGFVPSDHVTIRRYCSGASPLESDCAPGIVEAMRAQLIGDWNYGALIVSFAGHSSWQQWAHERLFHLDDLPLLQNLRNPPVVLELTCLTGSFHRPEPTLDEELLIGSGSGAVAIWGSTGLGLTTGQRWLGVGFFRGIFVDGMSTVGQATLEGKLALYADGQHPDLLDTFTLLGDPATRLHRTLIPWAARIYLPIVTRGH